MSEKNDKTGKTTKAKQATSALSALAQVVESDRSPRESTANHGLSKDEMRQLQNFMKKATSTQIGEFYADFIFQEHMKPIHREMTRIFGLIECLYKLVLRCDLPSKDAYQHFEETLDSTSKLLRIMWRTYESREKMKNIPSGQLFMNVSRHISLAARKEAQKQPTRTERPVAQLRPAGSGTSRRDEVNLTLSDSTDSGNDSESPTYLTRSKSKRKGITLSRWTEEEKADWRKKSNKHPKTTPSLSEKETAVLWQTIARHQCEISRGKKTIAQVLKPYYGTRIISDGPIRSKESIRACFTETEWNGTGGTGAKCSGCPKCKTS